jgi:putative oxidoreductase
MQRFFGEFRILLQIPGLYREVVMKFSLLFKKCMASNDGNAGYLLFRVFIGAMFITHGYGKVFGGLAGFTGFVGKMGIPLFTVLAPVAAYVEFAGGILLILGLFTRITAFLIVCDMAVAVLVAHAGAPFHVKELALVFLAANLLFLLKGAGKYSLDYPLADIMKGDDGGARA